MKLLADIYRDNKRQQIPLTLPVVPEKGDQIEVFPGELFFVQNRRFMADGSIVVFLGKI